MKGVDMPKGVFVVKKADKRTRTGRPIWPVQITDNDWINGFFETRADGERIAVRKYGRNETPPDNFPEITHLGFETLTAAQKHLARSQK